MCQADSMVTIFTLLVYVTSFQRKTKILQLHFAVGSSPFTGFHCQKSDGKLLRKVSKQSIPKDNNYFAISGEV